MLEGILNSKSRLLCAGRALLVSALFATPAAFALPVITYTATNLADLVVGEDLWRYDYVIGGPLGTFESVNIFFDATSYGELSGETAGSPLTALTTPSFMGSDGYLTLTADTAMAAGDSAVASVDFVWLLPTRAPGAQSFEHLDENFNVVGNGATSAVADPDPPGTVPEPSSALLVLSGLLLAGGLRARKPV